MSTLGYRHEKCKRGHNMAETRKELSNGDKVCYECVKLRAREWQRKHPKKACRASRDYKLKIAYGIDSDIYDEMLKKQDGLCAICGGKNKSGMNLSVDHDHKTGKVCGLLCGLCNTAIGLLRYDKDLFSRAAEYVELHGRGN